MNTIQNMANQYYDEIIALRRQFHAKPELSNQEFETSAAVKSYLEKLNLDRIETPYGTGVVAILHGTAGPGKCIAVRADMDALPVTEDTGLPFSSEKPGIMHACGHDMHTAMLLGIAKILSSRREQLHGTVKFIFQPAEEQAPLGGAKPMTHAGCLKNPDVDAIVAVHVSPDNRLCGAFGLYKGYLTTGFDLCSWTVKGKSGHGSQPHTANDAIVAAGQLIVLLQQIVSRKTDPLKTSILTIGTINGGQAVNIIPDMVTMEGVLRFYDEETRQTVRQQILNIASGMESVSGCSIDVNIQEGYSSVNNDPALVACAEKAFTDILGPQSVYYFDKPLSFSEDFSYYGNAGEIPSALFILSAGGNEEYSLHNAKCSMEENAMRNGMAGMAAFVENYLVCGNS